MSVRTRVADKQHRWLSQVEVTGIVLSEPVLTEVSPSGFRMLEKRELAKFYKARDIWNLPRGMTADPQAEWIRFILQELLGLKNQSYWLSASEISGQHVYHLPLQHETIRPSSVLVDDGKPILMFLQVPRTQSLDRVWIQKGGHWKASPTTKFERLLRETGVEVGLVTNGESWRVVVASPSETASWITWTVQTWADSPITLAAFVDLLGETRFFSGPKEHVFLELVRRSRERQLDVTERLGNQVREALDILLHEFDRIDAAECGAFLQDFDDEEVFDSGVVFLMRLLFLLYAEENGRLPHGTVAYDRSYGVLHLLTDLEHRHRLSPLALSESYEAFARLLATGRLVYEGSLDADISIVRHGGRLFDRDRYRLLEGRPKNGSSLNSHKGPPRVRDSIVRDVLRSLKYVRHSGTRQLVSYRQFAVEQIGFMYEGLLDLKAFRAPADSPLILLEPTAQNENPVLRYDALARLSQDELIELVVESTGRTQAQARKVLDNSEVNESVLEDARLAGVRTDNACLRLARPRGFIRARGLYLGFGEDRHSQGTHYTPPTITEPMVRNLLEPLVYENEADVDARQLRSPSAILALKVCDPAMGSGAFLVQVARFLSERLADAWENAATRDHACPLTLPEGRPVAGTSGELIMPDDRAEKTLWAKRFVIERCLYGVDINPLAVEMAKLSLWLEALSGDKPFSFLDHALRVGNSIIGVNQRQLINWALETTNRPPTVFSKAMKTAIQQATRMRSELVGMPPAAAIRQKSEALANCLHATARVRTAADIFCSAWLKEHDPSGIRELSTHDLLRLEAAESDEDWQRLETEAKERLGDHHPFHWSIEFPEVFERGGFDAVIGNPPYVRQELLGQIKPFLADAYQVFHGMADLYVYFYERGVSLLRPSGRLSMIVTNKWMKSGYGMPLRAFLSSTTVLESLVDFGHAKQIFKDADVFPCILQLTVPSGTQISDVVRACVIPAEQLRIEDLSRQIRDEGFDVKRQNFSDTPWQLTREDVSQLLHVMISASETLETFSGVRPLFGAKTGCNEAFVITTEQRNAIIEEDAKAGEILFPFLRGQDIKRWSADWAGLWMIFTRRGTDISSYPSIKRHLEEYRPQLEPKPAGWSGGKWLGRKGGDYEWFEIQDPVNAWETFLKPKLIIQRIAYHSRVTLCRDGLLTNDSTLIVPTDDLWILACLNSPAFWYYAFRTFPHKKDESLAVDTPYLRNAPIPSPSQNQRRQVEESVERMLELTSNRHSNTRRTLEILREDYGLEKVSRRLEKLEILSCDEFVKEIQKRRKSHGRLSRAEVAAVAEIFETYIASLQREAVELMSLEKQVAGIVHEAYRLTDGDLRFMLETAPPRMPLHTQD